MTSYAAVANEPGSIGLPSSNPSTTGSVRPVAQESQAYRHEKRVLRVRAAGFPRRLAASLIDLVLVILISSAVTAVAALALGVHLPSAKEFGADFVMAGLLDRNPMVVGAVGLFLGISGLYQIYLGGMLGQTVGKRLLHLRMITSRGQVPGPIIATLRFLTMAISLAPAGLGWLWCIFDRERRALHDHLAGTYVIFDER